MAAVWPFVEVEFSSIELVRRQSRPNCAKVCKDCVTVLQVDFGVNLFFICLILFVYFDFVF